MKTEAASIAETRWLLVSFACMLRALFTPLPRAVLLKKFLYWLLHDTVQSGASGRAIVDQAIADWIVAQRCLGPVLMITPTVIQDRALQALQVPVLFLAGEHEFILLKKQSGA